MAKDAAYYEAEKKIQQALESGATELDLHRMELSEIPKSFSQLKQLKSLNLSFNYLKEIPKSVGNLVYLESFRAHYNQLKSIPETFTELIYLNHVKLSNNKIANIPPLVNIEYLDLNDNPLNQELDAAYRQGISAVKAYLRAKAEAQITLNEAKLILVGEGEVGKTCLMDALLNKPWKTHDSTHGIEIQQIKVVDPETKKEIIMNGWDFGGQRVYRPTHQLFFSAPAVYLVVWKPREGPQQGFVKEWIQLIKRREPGAKIIVVATHGGPQMRQPDIDRQELWDLFSKETLVDFFFVDSKPNEKHQRKGIKELKQEIARVAANLPEVGRSVPKSFQDVRQALQTQNAPYLPLEDVLAICRKHKMDNEIAHLFISISHRLGHLTHYQNDPTLRDIVILRPDWLATAMSYVLDDEETRDAHGLVQFSRLCQLWNDPSRPRETRYNDKLHRVFLRLMERFDLSYRVAGFTLDEENNPVSLIAQLVPDNNPEKELMQAWPSEIASGDIQQIQICRIVDIQSGQSANAEGLFYQLIVRLHKFSLGRVNYHNSVHWQRGLILDDDYNGRALLRHIGNDIHITVRAPYPEFFLAMLTREVKYLVESSWEGLRCDVMVPCIKPCGKDNPGTGLFDVQKLIESKRKGRFEFPCPACNDWQDIDRLLRNAPSVLPNISSLIFTEFTEVKAELAQVRQKLSYQGEKIAKRFDRLDERTRRTLSRLDNAYISLLQSMADEAKEGPRLFSLVPVERNKFNPKEWVSTKFRLVLWCEHARLPLPLLNEKNNRSGIYEFDLTRDWFKTVSPYLKILSSTLILVLPVASSGLKLALDKTVYEGLADYLDFGKDVIDATLESSEKIGDLLGQETITDIEQGNSIYAHGEKLREFHALLKTIDPSNKYGGLVRVMNKRQEFLWVHERFTGEY